MPNSPTEPPTGEDEDMLRERIRSQVEAREGRKQAVVDVLRAKINEQIRDVTNARVEVLGKTNERGELENPERLTVDAERLAARHNNLCSGKEFAFSMANLSADSELVRRMLETEPDLLIKMGFDDVALGDTAPHKSMLHRATREGFFLQHYPVEKMVSLLQDQEHLVVEGWAAYPGCEPAPLADCQIDLYPFRKVKEGDQPALELPDTQESCDPCMWQYLHDDPEIFALVTDLATQKTHPNGQPAQNSGIAGMARHAAFEYIKQDINPKREERGEKPIRFAVPV